MRETLSWARTQKSHNPDSINIWLLFYCFNIIQLRAVSYFKQRPRVSLIYDPSSHTHIFTHTQTQKMVCSPSRDMKRIQKGRCLEQQLHAFEIETEQGWYSVSRSLEGWVTAYLFEMMKIFPSRQPFVVLVFRTACQICFSSLSCLQTAAIIYTYTQPILCFPHRPQQVCVSVTVVFFLKEERESKLAFGAPLPTYHLEGWIF